MGVKNGFLTSEFWVTLTVQVVALLAALGYLTPEETETWQKVAVQIGGLIAQVASGIYYAFTRKTVKIAATECECYNLPPEPEPQAGIKRTKTAGEIIAEKKAAAIKKPAPVGSKMSIVALLLSFGLIANCTMDVPLKTIDEMSPKQKAAFMMSVYNSEYDNYLYVSTRDNLTEDQKVILRKKKAALTKVYPLIESYSDYIAAGALPSEAKEKAIINLLDEIGGYVVQ